MVEEDALSYVLGYAMGNNISARSSQLPDISGRKFCRAESFDGFTPIGPNCDHSERDARPQALNYTTRVNREQRQETPTSDMIWSIRQIIQELS